MFLSYSVLSREPLLSWRRLEGENLSLWVWSCQSCHFILSLHGSVHRMISQWSWSVSCSLLGLYILTAISLSSRKNAILEKWSCIQAFQIQRYQKRMNLLGASLLGERSQGHDFRCSYLQRTESVWEGIKKRDGKGYLIFTEENGGRQRGEENYSYSLSTYKGP